MALICEMRKPIEGMRLDAFLDAMYEQYGAGQAPAFTLSPLAQASTDTSVRACAHAGSVLATPVGNHGGNDL